jgi:hypothetical protein
MPFTDVKGNDVYVCCHGNSLCIAYFLLKMYKNRTPIIIYLDIFSKTEDEHGNLRYFPVIFTILESSELVIVLPRLHMTRILYTVCISTMQIKTLC